MTDVALALFSTNRELIREAVPAGVEMIVVDWESRGKADRQVGADTEINHDTPEDLRRVRAATDAIVLCRINQNGEWTADELELAIAGGADEIMLPMVRKPADVERLLEAVDGRCKTGILIETEDAVASAADLATLPLSRVYFGLHDFAIERHTSNIFMPLINGTLERVREHFSTPFGFGGLTLPDRGSPVPCRLLLGEMARIGCKFSFLRRSFHRDVASITIAEGVSRIRNAVKEAARRSDAEIEAGRRELEAFVMQWPNRGQEASASRRVEP
ncbi:MAG TPA: aldolase/citrate lyase family protein [Thermoanaerobaculia bacterium]